MKQSIQQIKINEAVSDIISYLGNIPLDFNDGFADSESIGLYQPVLRPRINMDDSGVGEQLPVYLNTNDLRIIRNRSRVTCYFNEFALCGLENRAAYSIGLGLTVRAESADEKLAKRVQDFIDITIELNNLPTFIRESAVKADIDGETFIRCFYGEDGYTKFRRVQPEHVFSKTGDSKAESSFGIYTAPNDITEPLAYEIDGEGRVPASHIYHVKYNVIDGKRGIPTFFPVEANLRRCEQLLSNMSVMAKIRAKVALLRKLGNVGQTTANNLVQGLTRYTAQNPNDPSQTISVEDLPPGAIVTVGGGGELEMPNASVGASDFVEVLQAELRAVASRLRMAEWMFTALADAKYSNALIAEAPALRVFQELQDLWCGVVANNRYSYRASLIWRAIKHAISLKVLPANVITDVKLTATGPTIETRDRASDANTHKTYVDMGAMTVPEVRKDLNLPPLNL